ncbi:MAG: V-type ATP synthase subunit E [Promethearchaeati archaeon]
MHLIDQAKDKIKDLNQEMLFRKAEIKKRYRNRLDLKSDQIRKGFIEDYNNSLNKNLSSTLLESKERILELKNNLIKLFIKDLREEIKKRINSNYKGYVQYLLDIIDNIKNKDNLPKNSILYFNERDMDYFRKNIEKIKNIVNNEFQIKKELKIEIGGFILEQDDGEISFDYTIDNTIEENYSKIEMNFSNIIKDTEIKKLQKEFEEFVNQKKKNIGDYLIDYDRI